MTDHNSASPHSPVGTQSNGTADSLQREYVKQDALFHLQPAIVQHFLEAQANLLATALIERHTQVRFKLPDEVVVETSPPPDDKPRSVQVPQNQRDQLAGGLLDGLAGADLRTLLRNRLLDLEGHSEQAIAVAAGLLRFAAASHLVRSVLPAGRAVTYQALDGEEIPTQPISASSEPESAITEETDAIAETGSTDPKRGELLVPYVPAARRFFLPQWVAFDDEGNLIPNSVQEAEASVASMQQFAYVLHIAVGLAPYIVADEEYQRKRYGILGQLVNQGRALAEYQARQIIETIGGRGATGQLNRGLSVSLPYFDDQTLDMKLRNFQVIPAGRIMFARAFVTRAALEEQAKVAQDTRLNASTRKHLLHLLELLALAFEADSNR